MKREKESREKYAPEPEQKMMDLSVKFMALTPKVNSECNVDIVDIAMKRLEDAGVFDLGL